MTLRRGLVCLGVLAALGACATATPDKQLRLETKNSAVSGPMCERMRLDFDMRPAPSETEGEPVTYRANLADRLISAGGLYFTLTVDDGGAENACQAEERGLVCDARGPALVKVQTAAGRAQYRLREGEHAIVAAVGPRLTCQQLADD